MTGWLRGVLGVDEAQEDAARAAQTSAESLQDAGEIEAAHIRSGTQAAADYGRYGADDAAKARLTGGKTIADAFRRSGELSAGGYGNALDYLKQKEILPSGIRDDALRGLAGYYKVPQDKTQQQLIDEARSSPLYASILGTRQAGEEALARYASATGGLRSGGSQKDIYKYNQQLEKDALLTSFDERQGRQDYERMLNLQGLEGLSQLPGFEDLIAQYMAEQGIELGRGELGYGIAQGGAETEAGALRGQALSDYGTTRGQGEIDVGRSLARGRAGYGESISQGQLARGQIRSQGTENALNTVSGLAQAIATVFSDIRLKDDIRFLFAHHGMNYYGWTWNEQAKELGLEGEASGVLAHEVYELYPDAISEKGGYIQVNYGKLPPLEETH